jgi:hypothetical protein
MKPLHLTASAFSFVALLGIAMPAGASTLTDVNHNLGQGCQLTETLVNVTGVAVATAPPGNLDQYAVEINWGDGTIQSGIGTSFFEAYGNTHGTSDPYAINESHQYAAPGNYPISVKLYHTQGVGNDNQADVTAEFDVCLVSPLQIEKTAETSYTRAWDWSLDKTADQTSLELMDGQLFSVNYGITLGAVANDSAWNVAGTVSVTNPVGNRDVTITSIEDALSLDGNVTLDCPTDMTLAGGETLVCTYSHGLPGKNDQTNTVTVTTDVPVLEGSATASVVFGEPSESIDECAVLTDTAVAASFDQVCAGVDVLPKTYSYALGFGKHPSADAQFACGTNTYTNTASITANDTSAAVSDSVTLEAYVSCLYGQGCTLTQGYWKTHNMSFKGGAKADENWMSVGPLAEQTVFSALNPLTWFQTFWTAPAGNAYYNLAHQYMAAVLNKYNGASVPPAVQTALDSSSALFAAYSPAQVGALKVSSSVRKQFISLAGILGAYNEGKSGVPHCSEDATSAN